MNWLVLGKSGTGKSYFARRLAQRLAENKKLIVIDNSTDHDTIEGIFPIEVHSENIKKLSPRKIIDKFERVLLYFTYTDTNSVNTFLNRLMNEVWNKKNIVVLIDEAHIFFPRSNYPQELEMLVRAGRKGGIDIVFVTQQFVDLNLTALKQAHYFGIFRMTEQNEIDRVARYIPEARQILPTLEDYHLLFVDMNRGKWQIIKNDSI